MIKYADLHIHTTASDGSFTPEEVVTKATDVNLSAIAITDHDTVDGVIKALKMKNQNIEIIPGIEIDTLLEATQEEVHILGYFIEPKDPFWIGFFQRTKITREKRMAKMVKKLNQLGIDVTLEDVKLIAEKNTPLCRPHLARLLLDKKIVSSISEAFELYIGEGKPAYEPKAMPESIQMIREIKRKKGVAVLAHPGLIRNNQSLNIIVNSGELDGIECYHSRHSQEDTEMCLYIAHKHNLLITGGSDDHGTHNRIGRSILGEFVIPYELVERLKIFHQEVRLRYADSLYV